jgi:hypothetical protein
LVPELDGHIYKGIFSDICSLALNMALSCEWIFAFFSLIEG